MEWFTGIAGLSIIGVMWNKIKEFYFKINNLCFVNIRISSLAAKQAIKFYLIENAYTSPFRKYNIGSGYYYVKPLGKKDTILFEQFDGTYTFWLNKRPIKIKTGGELEITYFRPLFNRNQLINDIFENYKTIVRSENSKNQRFFVEHVSGRLGVSESANKESESKPEERVGSQTLMDTIPLQWKRDELGEGREKLYLDKLYLNPQAENLIKELEFWKKNESWFRSKDVPWKRGTLLYGSPGTGKSALIRAIGQLLDIPVLSFDLSTMQNKDFINEWNRALSMTPCIVLFEDFDAVFEGRNNISENSMQKGLTFDCLINQLDGVNNNEGILLFITTNCLEKIDSAIGLPDESDCSSRPGRIDKVIKMDGLDINSKEKMALRILGDFPREEWEFLLTEEKEEGAKFQEKCSNLAMNLFWNNIEEKIHE